jgi:predicted DNA-binding antitoxin AbrB/MazE fold protein
MTMTVQAVYTGGILRPVHPLALAEGETVEVTIASTSASSATVPFEDEETVTGQKPAKEPAGGVDADFERAAKSVFDEHEELLRRLA